MKLGERLKIARGENWLIPRYEEWLAARHDGKAEAELAAAILARPERDRSIGWSASSAGRCLREQAFKALRASSEDFPLRTHNIFQNGHYVHLRHQVAGLRMGYLEAVEVPVDLPDLKVKGTMDGKCSDGGGAEFKSINSRGFSQVRQFGPLSDHLFQINAYMAASGIEFFHVLYENKDTQELKEFRIERDEELIKRNKALWEQLNEHMDNKTLPPMLPECKKLEGRYNQCQFASVCLKTENTHQSLTQAMSSSGSRSTN